MTSKTAFFCFYILLSTALKMTHATMAAANWLIIPEIYPMQMPRCRIDNDWTDALTTIDGMPADKSNAPSFAILIDYVDEPRLHQLCKIVATDAQTDQMIIYKCDFCGTLSVEKDEIKNHYILVYTPVYITCELTSDTAFTASTAPLSAPKKYYIERVVLLGILRRLCEYCKYKL